MNHTLAKIKLEIDQGGSVPLGWNEEEPWDILWGRVLRDKDYWSSKSTSLGLPEAPKGSHYTPHGGTGRDITSWRTSGSSTRFGRGGRRGRQEKEQGQKGGQKTESKGGKRGIAELSEAQKVEGERALAQQAPKVVNKRKNVTCGTMGMAFVGSVSRRLLQGQSHLVTALHSMRVSRVSFKRMPKEEEEEEEKEKEKRKRRKKSDEGAMLDTLHALC